MPNYRTSQVFARLSDAELGSYTQNIITKLTGNPSFPTPLVSVANLTTALTDYTAAMAAAEQGGKLAPRLPRTPRAKPC